MSSVKVTNLKTGKVYHHSPEEVAAIKANPLTAKLFKFHEPKTPVEVSKTSEPVKRVEPAATKTETKAALGK